MEIYKRKFAEEYKRLSTEQLMEFIQKAKINEAEYTFESANTKAFYVKCSGNGTFNKTEEGFNIAGKKGSQLKIEYNQIHDVIFLIGDDKKFDIKDVKGNNIIIKIISEGK